MRKLVNIYAGQALANYGFPGGHPFSMSRFGGFWEEFTKRQLDLNPGIKVCSPVIADITLIELFHSCAYVEQVLEQSKTGEGYLDSGDTPAFEGVFEAASYVVGTSVQAMNDILSGNCQHAFVPIAGLHHARRDRASGFCVFNDCGVVIESLLTNHQLERVAYVDIDAHQGDGVYYDFESDPRVIVADLHEDGKYLFPGTGAETEVGTDKGKGFKLNIPMPPVANDELFFQCFDRALGFIADHKPQFIILQCGVDSMAGDPLTHLKYSYHAHAYATRQLVGLANKLGHSRVLCLGGGGYNLQNIASGWCAVVEALVE